MILVFGLGLCVGSFLNVVIYRMLNGDSPTRGRSYCDHCKRQLRWFENIPLLSFVVLRGKCRTCKKMIDRSYPMVEFGTGLLFLWWASLGFAFFRLTQSPLTFLQPGFWLLVGVALLVVFFTDLIYGIIPDVAVVVLGLSTLVYRLVLVGSGEMKVFDFGLSVLSGVVVFLVFLGLYLGTRGKGMGFGDVKFALVMGLLLGFPKAVVGVFLSFVLGGLVGVVLLATGRKKMKQKVPFGPFLVVGTVLALVWGEQMWHMYLGWMG